jgi:hypothetical protein
MNPNLETTNLFLGIIAAVSVLEALVIIGLGIAGFMAYRRVMRVVNDLEERHVQPAMARLLPLMDTAREVAVDIQQVTATMRNETERVDQAVHRTIDRVDHTVGRVRSNVRARTSWLVGAFKGARVALEHVLQS